MGGFGSGRRSTGGRQPGAKNVITEKVKGDLLAVYRQLGGRRWLLAYARDNPDEFVKHLMRLLPPPREDLEPDTTPPAPDSLFDSARKIAFILALAQHEQEARTTDVELVEMAEPPPQAPEQQDPAPLPPLDEAPVVEPCAPPKSDPEGIEETEAYRGSAAEQGRLHTRPEAIDQRRQAHDDYVARLAARHRRSLL